MLLQILEIISVFSLGYLGALLFTYDNEDISVSLIIPALIGVFVIEPTVIMMRTGSWWGGGDALGEYGRLIQERWYWAFIGFIVFLAEQGLLMLLDLYDDESIATETPNRGSDKPNHMGSSSSNFHDKSLDFQAVTIIKLAHSAFGHLDRQVSASVEANLDIRPNQRKNVQRLLAEVIDQKPSVPEILRPLKRMQQGGHNAAYSIFDKLCVIAAQSQRYNQATLKNLISIAQQLGLSQEEIYYLFQKSRLAV